MTASVSVIIPTLNRAATLPRALDSVIKQTFADWEIVLVDDGSSDNTSQIVERYKDRLGDKLRYIYQERGGASAARNTGIDSATGEFIAFLDSDDEYLPEKIAAQVELFEKCPQLGLVYGDFSFVDLDGARNHSAFDTKLLQARMVRGAEVAPRRIVCDKTLFDALLGEYFIATIVGMVRRDVLGSDLRFDRQLCYAEEWLFYLRIAHRTRVGFVNEPLCLHHFTEGSLARSSRVQNARRRCDVLAAIADAFPALTRRQRRIIRTNRARAHQQVAYDLCESGEHVPAARQFLTSFLFRPAAGSFRGTLSALAHSASDVGRSKLGRATG